MFPHKYLKNSKPNLIKPPPVHYNMGFQTDIQTGKYNESIRACIKKKKFREK